DVSPRVPGYGTRARGRPARGRVALGRARGAASAMVVALAVPAGGRGRWVCHPVLPARPTVRRAGQGGRPAALGPRSRAPSARRTTPVLRRERIEPARNADLRTSSGHGPSRRPRPHTHVLSLPAHRAGRRTTAVRVGAGTAQGRTALPRAFRR